MSRRAAWLSVLGVMGDKGRSASLVALSTELATGKGRRKLSDKRLVSELRAAGLTEAAEHLQAGGEWEAER